MLGEGRVGKTSLTLKYCKGQFNESEPSTVNASCLEKVIEIDGNIEKLAIWDTAGQEMFSGMAPIYYRNAEGAVLVYDITMKETFKKLTKWIKELREHAGEDLVIALAGNKYDKVNDRAIDVLEVEKYANELGIKHFHTSAKNGKGITDAFEYLTTEIYKKRNPKLAKLKKIKIVDKSKIQEESTSNGCC